MSKQGIYLGYPHKRRGIKVQTTIVKWGNSQGIRLHRSLLEMVNLTDNDKVDVTTENNSIIIKKASQKRVHIPLKARLKGWKEQPYELTDEDYTFLNMEAVGEEV
jgi:antitoxin MazE